MENNPHYLKVGIFVIIFTTIFIILSLWLSVGLNSTVYDTYLAYMTESVSGLSKKAPVKYNGVEVGYVSAISLCKENPKLVMLSLAIDDRVPVYTSTRAVLETQGLTGIAFVGLKGGAIGDKRLTAEKHQKYPVIKSTPSLFFRLDNALDDLTHNLNEISAGLTTVLTPENTHALADMIQNFNHVSADLKHNTAKLDVIMNNTAKATRALPDVMNSVKISAQSVQTFTANANQTLNTMSATVSTINDQLLPQVQSSMTDLQSSLSNFKAFSQDLEQNPSVMIRGKQAPPRGPGE
jgi:phospholipid/cholesterol/gamma-HCH transport system substrate-binding protein